MIATGFSRHHSSHAPIKVLLVEDDPDDAWLVRDTLAGQSEFEGFNITQVSKLKDALHFLRWDYADAIVLDLSLPDSHGLDTLAYIQAAAPGVPVIVFTIYDDDQTGLDAVRHGAQDYLVKGRQDSLVLRRTIRHSVERMHAKEVLRRSERRLRTIIEHNADGIIIVNSDGIVRFLNPAARNMLNHRAGELVGEYFGFPLVSGESTEVDLVQSTGDVLIAELRVVETEWKGVPAFLVSLRDITLRKRAEEQLEEAREQLEQRVEERTRELLEEIEEHKRTEEMLLCSKQELEIANRAKTDFLASMSHELRTPLNAIIGFSEGLQTGLMGKCDSKCQEYITDIHSSGLHLLEVINDILDVSKVEAGEIDLHEEMHRVADLVESSLRLIKERARNAQIDIATAVDGKLPGIRADGRRMKQILLNLLSNAVKFTPRGGSVLVKAFRNDQGGIALSIADTGIGMAPEDIPQAMRSFGQLDNGWERKYEGTGLGLPLTKGLVELHGGTLAIESAPGMGTTVTVSFPAERNVPCRMRR